MNTSFALFAARRTRLRTIMKQAGLTGLLVSQAANRFYLSGFELHNPQENESAGMLLIAENGKDILYTDPRYTDAALRLWPKERLCIYHGTVAETIASSISALIRGTLGIEEVSMSCSFYKHFVQAVSPSVALHDATGLVSKLRIIKSPEELECMDSACALNHAMMSRLPAILTPGKTEAQAAWEIERFFRENGASELAFSTIVGRGANAALPHCIPGTDTIEDDNLVLVDAGCRVNNYCSDQTRTLWIGTAPSQRFRETLEAVQEAQRLSIELIRPGIPCCEVYQAAREHFVRLGVAKRFTHSLGHGVGLETHEAPHLSPSDTTILAPGMVITVEPGLYDPSWGGIRWEHMVAVTEDGHRIL